MSSTLQKIRSSTSQKEPKDLLDLDISGQYAILSESDQWFMDGTFNCLPIKLMQLFTIHPLIINLNEAVTLPCIFILTQQRTKKTYLEIFGFLKNLAIKQNLILYPKYVMADFEKATIFRRTVRIGLKQHYSKDEYRDFIDLLEALALIPIEHVQQGFEIIKSLKPNDNKCDELIDYFDKDSIKKIEPAIWNLYSSDIRKNNKIEGFYPGLNKLVSTKHLNTQDTQEQDDVNTSPPPNNMDELLAIENKVEISDENETVETQTYINLETVTFEVDNLCTEVPVSNIVINRQIPLASMIAYNPRFYDEDETNARERARVKAAIDATTAAITKADIDAEVKRQWIKTGVTERSRISGLDRDAAFKRLKQKIEFEDEQQKHLDFLERYGNFFF
ncbi:unnamed protein product [Brachionus calyciflorus]|uniref:MULE transposase domain-containing protein n=1 Tax=Brachionus calyciflorus TaxID=104777 RepID=A0A814BH36_9BILA|nr:unnamed protein product [Brachionus calyciflorus]